MGAAVSAAAVVAVVAVVAVTDAATPEVVEAMAETDLEARWGLETAVAMPVVMEAMAVAEGLVAMAGCSNPCPFHS